MTQFFVILSATQILKLKQNLVAYYKNQCAGTCREVISPVGYVSHLLFILTSNAVQ